MCHWTPHTTILLVEAGRMCRSARSLANMLQTVATGKHSEVVLRNVCFWLCNPQIIMEKRWWWEEGYGLSGRQGECGLSLKCTLEMPTQSSSWYHSSSKLLLRVSEGVLIEGFLKPLSIISDQGIEPPWRWSAARDRPCSLTIVSPSSVVNPNAVRYLN